MPITGEIGHCSSVFPKKVMLGIEQGLLRLLHTKPPGNNSQIHATRGVVRTFYIWFGV